MGFAGFHEVLLLQKVAQTLLPSFADFESGGVSLASRAIGALCVQVRKKTIRQ
jgi:hypothetical protein